MNEKELPHWVMYPSPQPMTELYTEQLKTFTTKNFREFRGFRIPRKFFSCNVHTCTRVCGHAQS